MDEIILKFRWNRIEFGTKREWNLKPNENSIGTRRELIWNQLQAATKFNELKAKILLTGTWFQQCMLIVEICDCLSP